METFKAIGIMSGTSLDGLDLAHVVFKQINGTWGFDITHAQTIVYPKTMVDGLRKATQLSGLELKQLDLELGRFIGQELSEFISSNNLNPDLVGSHGHTVFHQPRQGLTHQIGDGNSIYALTEIPIVFDFRSLDVARGGDGAPLVPIGDRLLFPSYDACLNLGGIANISFDDASGARRAYDVVAFNMVLNTLARRLGYAYDEGGQHARAGSVDQALLAHWNELAYYHAPYPKSLGYEWFEKHLLPTLDGSDLPGVMHTYCLHAAHQIHHAVTDNLSRETPPRVLVTGGGAYNDFFMECLQDQSGDQVIWTRPEPKIIEYKEAMVFAFLAVLRSRHEVNVLRSATGATQDSVGGIMLGHPLNMP